MSSQYSPRGPMEASSGPGGFFEFEPPPPEDQADPGRNELIPGVIERFENIIKSANDKRVYRGLLLSNEMKVLLVSDPATDMSAAALQVSVGSMSDSKEVQGLAHFCEHMLFLGTKKYPEENGYDKFIAEHGGYTNAYTSADQTTYYFDVATAHLKKALDIFAQFFLSPLFTESATGREINAVHSEYEMNAASDFWRLSQLRKSLAASDHPYHKFNIGNKESLETIPKSKNIDVRKELLKFHQKWYSSNIMSLVVFGKESLDELEDIVVPLFSNVENKSVTAPSWPEHPFSSELCRKRIYSVPVKDVLSLNISFPIPDLTKHYKSYTVLLQFTLCNAGFSSLTDVMFESVKLQPERYLTQLLRHEGPGSLNSLLKRKGWSDEFDSWSSIDARGFGFLHIKAELTEEGIDRVDDIIKLVFQYIAMLKTQGPQSWIKEEQSILDKLAFAYKDTLTPICLVESIVHRLQEYPMEDVLSANYLVPEWKPEIIMQLLSLLTPENVLVEVRAKSFEDKCTMVEPWYGTKYLKEDIDEAILKEWSEVQLATELHLPPPNEFIPLNLALEESQDPTCETVAPEIIKDTKYMRLWFKRDNEFRLPKAMTYLFFNSPLVYTNPLSYNLGSMWARMLMDGLDEIGYAAQLTDLYYHIGVFYKYGICVSIEGYDEKQHVLLEKIIHHILNFKADSKRFQALKEKYMRDLKNYETDQPHEHAIHQRTTCLEDIVYTNSELLDVANEMTPELVTEFASRMMKYVHVEGIMYGNLNRERALKMADSVEQKLPKDGTPVLPQHLLLCREIELGKGAWYLREIQNSVHKSSCASLYYGCGTYDLRSNVTLDLLSDIMAEPCFNVLRTKEQLGYRVFNSVRLDNGTHGLTVTVQSDRHPLFLEHRIECFVEGFLEYLQNMSENDFTKHKNALAAKVLEKPKQMCAVAKRMWCEIVEQMYNFDRARVEVEQLNTVTKEELIQFYMKHISIHSPERQKLSVYVVSTAEGGAGTKKTTEEETDENSTQKTGMKATPITDIAEFKSSKSLFPRNISFIDVPLKGVCRN